MKLSRKAKISEIKTLNLKGVQILSITEGSSDDLRCVQLRDTVTGLEFGFSMGQYSDFHLTMPVPPKTETRFIASGKMTNGAEVRSVFESESEAKNWIESIGEPKLAITTEQVVVE